MKTAKASTRLAGPEITPMLILLHDQGFNEYDLFDPLGYCDAGLADYTDLRAFTAYDMGYTWSGARAHGGVLEGESLDKQTTEIAQTVDAWVVEYIPAVRSVVAMGLS